jgi:hypothetical protein
MDLLLLRVFQAQVRDQCRFVLTSVPLINESAAKGDQDMLWIGCQMFVVGAGNVSKALWGAGRKRTTATPARRPLRDSLETDDSSALYSIPMRNHFEHYDERIEEWWAKSERHNIADRTIGPPSAVSGLERIEMFRFYDPVASRVVFWGEEFDLQPIADECHRIMAVAEREAAKPHWET